jgi:hypothetical protein
MAKDYNSINFKNKDIDKFATRFGQGDPVKGIVSQAKDAMNTIAKTPRSKGTIDFYTDANTLNSIDTTGIASGKNNFTVRNESGAVLGTTDNKRAKEIVRKVETGFFATKKNK